MNKTWLDDAQRTRNRIRLSLVMFILSAFAITPILFISDTPGFSIIALVSAILIFAFGIAGVGAFLSIAGIRKSYVERGVYKEKRSEAVRYFLPFFSNKYTVIADIFLFISIIMSWIITQSSLPLPVEIFYGYTFVLSLEFHFLLNSKNFDFYYDFLKDKENKQN